MCNQLLEFLGMLFQRFQHIWGVATKAVSAPLMLACSLLAACSHFPHGSDSSEVLDTWPHPTHETMALTPGATLAAALAKSIPSYTGIRIGPQREVTIALAAAQDSEPARAVAMQVWGSLFPAEPLQLVIVQSTLTPTELAGAMERMTDVLTLTKTVYLAPDGSCGCVVVGITDAAADADVRAFAQVHGVPPAAVHTVITKPFVRHLDLDSSIRPTRGGLKIESWAGTCSLGLPVYHTGMAAKGFLTASHCTEGTQGGPHNTWFSQPGGAWFWGDKVGEENIDPSLFDARGDAHCDSGRLCRKTDVSFQKYDYSILGFVGRISKPSTRCTTAGQRCGIDVSSASDDIRVTAVAGPVAVVGCASTMPVVRGDTIDKVGRTTGWTSGTVLQTCARSKVSNDDGSDAGITLLDQVIVSAVSDHGDSGSPAFVYDTAAGTASFAGILWGGSNDTFVFSPVSGIVLELGSMEFHE